MNGFQRSTLLRSSPKKQIGAASAVDFVLTIPIFSAAILVIVQIGLIAHASLIVRQAAYSAARTAKIQLVDSDHAFRELDCCSWTSVWVTAETGRLGANMLGADFGEWRKKAQSAAMKTLVAISPGNKDIAEQSNPNPSLWDQQFMARYYNAIATNNNYNNTYSPRAKILLNKSKYAFDEDNSNVDIAVISFDEAKNIVMRFNLENTLSQANRFADLYSFGQYAERNTNMITSVPVRATVTFRFPLQIPFAAAIFNNDPCAVKVTSRWTLAAKRPPPGQTASATQTSAPTCSGTANRSQARMIEMSVDLT